MYMFLLQSHYNQRSIKSSWTDLIKYCFSIYSWMSPWTPTFPCWTLHINLCCLLTFFVNHYFRANVCQKKHMVNYVFWLWNYCVIACHFEAFRRLMRCNEPSLNIGGRYLRSRRQTQSDVKWTDIYKRPLQPFLSIRDKFRFFKHIS